MVGGLGLSTATFSNLLIFRRMNSCVVSALMWPHLSTVNWIELNWIELNWIYIDNISSKKRWKYACVWEIDLSLKIIKYLLTMLYSWEHENDVLIYGMLPFHMNFIISVPSPLYSVSYGSNPVSWAYNLVFFFDRASLISFMLFINRRIF